MDRKTILLRAIFAIRFDAISIGTLGISVGAALVPAIARGQIIIVLNSEATVGVPVSDGSVGEYTMSGATVNAPLVSGFGSPEGIAASGPDLFVANDSNGGTIGEYTTSGATVNASLVSGFGYAMGIAVSGSDLFVPNSNFTIGEYTTSGATVNAALVSGVLAAGIAASGSDLFITDYYNGTIGEYTTSGATVNASLISGLGQPGSIAVSGSDLFVADDSNGTIGEYTTSGATVNASLVSGLNSPSGLAVSGSLLFVADRNNNTIGEYTTSGVTINTSLVPGLGYPVGITVAEPPFALTWNNSGGSGDGMNWDATSQNWNDGIGPNVYTDGSGVLFNDANNGNYAVTLNTTVSPGWATVNNCAGNYTISGAGCIAGYLTKMGSGLLTLNTTVTGGTTVSAGKLVVGATGALLGGNVTINGGALQICTGGGLSAQAIVQYGGCFTDPGMLQLGGGGNAGSYNLCGGTSNIYDIWVASGGAINQTGGTCTINNNLEVDASYTLSGGTLSTSGEEGIGGNEGGATFNQTGGTNTPGGGLIINSYDGSNVYTLGCGATLSSQIEIIGGDYTSANAFNQTGGTNTINGNLDVGGMNGGGGDYSYTLSGGVVTAKVLSLVGSYYNQTAGKAVFGLITGTGQVTITGGLTILAVGGGASQVGGLNISGNGVLDITNNCLFINYGSGPDPIASIAAWIANGYYGLPGPQIISSAIAMDDALSGLSYGIGYADGADGVVAGLPSGEIEIMFTLLGDANLDGTVNTEDFTPFSTNLGKPGGWDQGDFNYDGTVNTEDFTSFSHNLNQSASLAAGALETANGVSLTDVPEPACAGMMVMAGLGILRRRRRSIPA